MGIRDWLARNAAQPTVLTPDPEPSNGGQEPALPPDDALPPIGARMYRIVDIPGTFARRIAEGSTYPFLDWVDALPEGPTKVTLRLVPNEANKYGINAYVRGKQVGWMNTEWKASDGWVKFMTRLEAANILPRFPAAVRNTGNNRYIELYAPPKKYESLPRIADELTGKAD